MCFVGVVIGNAHLGESEQQRIQAIQAVKALLEPSVPTMIQGADSLAEVGRRCFAVTTVEYVECHTVVREVPYKCV